MRFRRTVRHLQRIIGLLVLASLVSCAPTFPRRSAPLAKGGALDLRGWDFDEDGRIRLDGEWEFYWNEFVDPTRSVADESIGENGGFVAVPGSWEHDTAGGGVPRTTGFGSYRLIVHVDSDAQLALKVLDFSSAFSLLANGELVFAGGVVGTDHNSTRPAYRSGTAVVAPSDGKLELIVHVANFSYRRGGAWNPITLGTPTTTRSLHEWSLMAEAALFGALALIGFYHLGLYLLRRRDPSTLYFGLFCLLIGLRVTLTGERIAHAFDAVVGWSTLVRLEYLSWYVAAPLFVAFLGELYSEVGKLLTRAAIFVSSIFSAIVVVTSPLFFSRLLPAAQVLHVPFAALLLAALVRAANNKKKGAILIAAGAVFVVATVFHDIVVTRGWTYNINLAPVGTLVIVVAQAFVLSARSARAFALSEELSSELEERVRRRTRRLVESNRRLKDTQAQLVQAQKLEALGTMAGGMAHEFNNYLGAIVGYSEILRDSHPEGSAGRGYLESLHTAGSRATELVRQILTFSHVDSAPRVVQPIQATVAEAVELVRVTLPPSIELVTSIDEAAPSVSANLNQISQLVVNLCANASGAMNGRSGRIEVILRVASESELPAAAQIDAGALMVRVTDEGEGIPEDVRARMFDPFFTTKRAGQGTGLGLSIVHGIVKGHGGAIDVQSEPGQGATVSVFIPLNAQDG